MDIEKVSRIGGRRIVSRRRFVRAVAGVSLAQSGVALLGGCGDRDTSHREAAVEPPPETTQLRLSQNPAVCAAPQWYAEALLRDEGFTTVEYVKSTQTATPQYTPIGSGEVDLSVAAAPTIAAWIDAGFPVVALAGVHVGCYELFATARIRQVRDLKGATVAVPLLGGAHQLFLSSILAYIGLKARTDVTWVAHPSGEAMQLLAEERVDAYLGFPPEPQEMRAKRIGHVVLNTALDVPWSRYFCCIMTGNRDFVKKHPVATKRALRAILKATDLCSQEPERVVRALVDRGFIASYDNALATIKDLPYGKWREHDPEDSLRFHALRLREAGLVKSSPKTIISRGTDWRFLNELKKEMKV